MPTFTITGNEDPFLHVSLRKGERISCESDAMVMMESNLDLQSRMQGGLLSALARRLANGESFFQQHITATRGDGDCLLAPMMNGGIEVLDVGAVQYKISDGAYMAATADVAVTLFTIEVTPDNPITVDNGHVVAWDSSLEYKISLSTEQERGLLGNIINSVTSGEGIVLKFSGRGKVIICSRNLKNFAGWVASQRGA